MNINIDRMFHDHRYFTLYIFFFPVSFVLFCFFQKGKGVAHVVICTCNQMHQHILSHRHALCMHNEYV